MKIKELLQRLNEIVKANPANADIDIYWYDEFEGHVSHGDGKPIKLYYFVESKKAFCLMNAVDGNPHYYTCIEIPDEGIKDESKTTNRGIEQTD